MKPYHLASPRKLYPFPCVRNQNRSEPGNRKRVAENSAPKLPLTLKKKPQLAMTLCLQASGKRIRKKDYYSKKKNDCYKKGEKNDYRVQTGSSSSEGASAASRRRRGKCKWFNVAKGWGFITPMDGGADVFVHQSVIQMSGFRSLGDEEEVEFECKVSDKGLEATLVTGPEEADCKGSHRRPMSKKRFRKIRCYNCGEFANHIAAKCNLGPQPKRCHSCKSDDHLIADCPARETTKTGSSPETTTKTTNGSHDTPSSISPTPSEEQQHDIE
ncbi:hypothetical protein JTE90_014612 [Oedothorax gibbosus]|uniref:CSD domain-containing protein n=1 Tax=Oedothorax gibbosus TaxID=931172 RepID=A0AAV6V8L2_9ARAC|nr:hypothetical protein JTE90_014612 [Oedothorax gibbosus]